MGADIYLTSVHDQIWPDCQRRFDAALARRTLAIEAADQAAARAAGEEAAEAYEALMNVDGYFRDSYNQTSIAPLLGLDWADVARACDDGALPLDTAASLLAYIEAAPPITLAMLAAADVLDCQLAESAVTLILEATVDSFPLRQTGRTPPERWLAYFERKRERLGALLKRSIALGEPLQCSL